jgi:hypothetical protein
MRNRNRWFRRAIGVGRRQLAFADVDKFGRPRVIQRGRNRGDKPGSGPAGNCVCPSCGAKVSHTVNSPCNETKCPKCNTIMTRE